MPNKPAEPSPEVKQEEMRARDYHWATYEGETIRSMHTRPDGSTVLILQDGRGVAFEGRARAAYFVDSTKEASRG